MYFQPPRLFQTNKFIRNTRVPKQQMLSLIEQVSDLAAIKIPSNLIRSERLVSTGHLIQIETRAGPPSYCSIRMVKVNIDLFLLSPLPILQHYAMWYILQKHSNSKYINFSLKRKLTHCIVCILGPCLLWYLLKVIQFRKQIFLFSFEPQTEHKF